MKVVFLTASTSRSAGGLFFTITNYTKALKLIGVDVKVVGIDDPFSAEDRKAFGDVEVVPYKRVNLPVLSQLGYSLDLSGILEYLKPDIIHLQGLWMYHSWAALKYHKRHNVKVIIEPHGMLDPWALHNSSWKKKIAGLLFEYENLRSADMLHSLCDSEEQSIRDFGLTNPIKVIPNGVVLPDFSKRKKSKEKNLVFLGRIHPKKGIRNLIEAIGIIYSKTPKILENWNIKVAGWNQGRHLEELIKLVADLKLESKVLFVGPVFGEQKKELLTNSDLFILPSYSEGLPMAILEAWSYRLPTIMTDFCNLPEGFEQGCSIKIDTNPEHIASVLTDAFSLSDVQLESMGNKAYDLVKEKFTWDIIARDTKTIYDLLLKV